MNAIKKIMTLIDKNSQALPEGDYLEICDALKEVYDEPSSDPVIFKRPVMLDLADEDDSSTRHFHDYYNDYAHSIECDYAHTQIEILDKMCVDMRPLRYVTAPLKDMALRHYCSINHLHDIELTEEGLRKYLEDSGNVLSATHERRGFKAAVKEMYKSFLVLENTFRGECVQAFRDKIREIKIYT
jgi:hypothetical protein